MTVSVSLISSTILVNSIMFYIVTLLLFVVISVFYNILLFNGVGLCSSVEMTRCLRLPTLFMGHRLIPRMGSDIITSTLNINVTRGKDLCCVGCS